MQHDKHSKPALSAGLCLISFKVKGELDMKLKFKVEVEEWMLALLVAAFALVWPVASNASEFPGMGAAYAQRLEQYRKISSLWLATRAVGIDTENGHYQAIVTINQQLATNNQPPTYLVCGPYKVVVTQPGTYRFPLEVFKHYPTRTYPEALPLTITYDDGFTDISHPPLNTSSSVALAKEDHHSYLNTKSAPPPDNIYDVYMHPTLYLWPSTIALSVAESSSVTFKCNVPSSARVYFSSMWQMTKIILRGSRLAEIEEAEVEDLVTIFVETADGTTSGSFAIVDDRPRHYCSTDCNCPDCLWCISSTNNYSSVTNDCPCCGNQSPPLSW